MAIPHQKSIVVVLWCVAIVAAVWQGVSLPQSDLVALPSENHQFNPALLLFGLLGPPACILGTALLMSSSKVARNGTGPVSRWVDSRWGAGSIAGFLRNLRPTALVGLGAFILGSVDLVSSVHSNAGSFAFETASFFLSAGIGFGIARVIALRLMPNEPWV